MAHIPGPLFRVGFSGCYVARLHENGTIDTASICPLPEIEDVLCTLNILKEHPLDKAGRILIQRWMAERGKG